MIVAVTGSRGVLGRQLMVLLADSGVPLTGDVRLAATYDQPFDWLVHLAGAMPHHFKQDAALALEVNVEGTRQALEACRRHGAGLILASSSAVYPVDRLGAIGEEVVPAPVTPYGESKLLAEMLATFYHRHHGLPIRILRFFNIYGPGQGVSLLPGYLIHQALRGEKIILRTPLAGRDFLHVLDGARAVKAALTMGDAPYSVFNVGSGVGHRVKEWVAILEKLLAHPLDVAVEGAASQSEDQVIADVTRCCQCLSWHPTIALEDGISMTLRAEGLP